MIEIYFALETALIVLVAIYVLNRYAQRETPIYVKVAVFLSWFLGFYIIAILPVDIYIVSIGL